jgi:HEAT repeat protein
MALGTLNTRETKKKLAALAEHSDRDGIRQPAIGALAQTRDLAVLPVLKRIAGSGVQGDRDFALWNMGQFGKAAVPFLASTLRQKDLNTQIAAIRGLGASATRSAVPILIELLRSSERQLVIEARVNLAQLTHFSIDGNPYPQTPPRNEWRRWHDWWVSHQANAEIFDTNNCSQPRPLP